jgi:hypothetical protein
MLTTLLSDTRIQCQETPYITDNAAKEPMSALQEGRNTLLQVHAFTVKNNPILTFEMCVY